MLDVRVDDRAVLVRFRWQEDPESYGIEVEIDDPTISPWTGLRADPRTWAADVYDLVQEELATGLMDRARRRDEVDHIRLDWL